LSYKLVGCNSYISCHGSHKNTEAPHSRRLLLGGVRFPNALIAMLKEELFILEPRRLNTSGPHPFGRGLSHNPSVATRRRDAGPRLTSTGRKRLGLGPVLGPGSSRRPAPASQSSTSSYGSIVPPPAFRGLGLAVARRQSPAGHLRRSARGVRPQSSGSPAGCEAAVVHPHQQSPRQPRRRRSRLTSGQGHQQPPCQRSRCR
jgi:hypothetical protein